MRKAIVNMNKWSRLDTINIISIEIFGKKSEGKDIIKSFLFE